MRNSFSLLTVFLIPALIWATPNADLAKVVEPPRDAPTGEAQDGVQIGLWTEKAEYEGNEIRNVWTIARNDRSSSITIGVGGSLYSGSYLFVTKSDEKIAKFPIGGGVDGIVNPTSIFCGLSGKLATLPAGTYQLLWKTDTHESNLIEVEIKPGGQGESLKP
ncbi:MAG: hypothetical protein AAGD22_04555 [Verrucomicrobiota bacterium]